MSACDKEYTAKLLQGGIVVAEVTATTFDQCWREILHYALMYSQDGPVTIQFPIDCAEALGLKK